MSSRKKVGGCWSVDELIELIVGSDLISDVRKGEGWACTYIPTFLCLDENLMSAGVISGRIRTGHTGSCSAPSSTSASAVDAERRDEIATEDRLARETDGDDRDASDEMEMALAELASVVAREVESDANAGLVVREACAMRRVRKDAIRLNE